MSLNYDMDGFKLAVSAGLADEAKGKRRWTRVEASFMGCPCSGLEALASLKATLDCFRRGQLARSEPWPCLGTEAEGVLCGGIKQKDKVQYLHMQRMADGRAVEEAYLTQLDVARLEIAVGKTLQFLAPATIWGPEQ